MVKQKGRRGQKRKSARILALEALKRAKKETNTSPSPNQDNAALSPPMSAAEAVERGMEDSSSRQCLAQPRRGRKKKRLDEVVVTDVGPTTQQSGEPAKREAPPVNSTAVLPSKQQMPEKSILEFILDILQTRDKHEIFAQPVDPNEVEGYYSIIVEPMDFGTMRAKLQEGIYTTSEQFENDVFLVTNNAMLFNSSATIYFRQARAIHELAKKVFHTLKTNPQKIEQEFSLTTKRYGKKPRGEYGGSRVKLGTKHRVNNPAYCGSDGANPLANEILSGHQFGRNLYDTERRKTYTPQYSAVSEEESIFSTVYSSSKQLVSGNGSIGYKESLLRFVKDLGPVAQKVAREKLNCSTQTSMPLVSSTASQQQPTCINGIMNNVTSTVNNPQGSHGTLSKGKNIVINDSTGIDLSTSRGRMELGTGRLDIPNAVSKGKSVLIGDSMDSYVGPLPRETLTSSGKYMDLLQGDGREDIANCSQKIQRQLCSSYLRNDHVQPSHSASKPQPVPGLSEFLSSCARRPQAAVYPSTVIKPSGSSQVYGPGQESNAPLDLNCGASSSPVSQPTEWNRATLWPPQAMGDFQANLSGNEGFVQQKPKLAVNQYLQAKSSNKSPLGPVGFPRQQRESQVASAAPYVQLQPYTKPPSGVSGMNPLGQDALLQQELLSQSAYTKPPSGASGMTPLGQDALLQQELLSQCAYTKPQPSLLNLFGQDFFEQPNTLGQQLVLPQYVQPQPSNVNPVGKNGLPSQQAQPGLPYQGGLTSDQMYFSERDLMRDRQQNSNAQFWNLQQQFLRGTTSQHPDLDLQLQTRNRRS